ncbi:MAG: hypothetical protein U0235_12060 [Polyangiaceae bacterium]
MQLIVSNVKNEMPNGRTRRRCTGFTGTPDHASTVANESTGEVPVFEDREDAEVVRDGDEEQRLRFPGASVRSSALPIAKSSELPTKMMPRQSALHAIGPIGTGCSSAVS